MRTKLNVIQLTIAMSFFFLSCQKESNQQSLSSEILSSSNQENENEEFEGSNTGHVYTSNNQTTGNAVLDYVRSANGTLTFSAAYPTGGNGTGGGLGNQGAVILADENILLAVNAGSNSISSFKIRNNGLQLKATVGSGGTRPVSITQYDDIVFVLNAGGTNNITGFRLSENGTLQAIPNSSRPLTAAMTGPAEIAFVKGGKVLVITEKMTNKIVSYTVNENGIPGSMHSITSSSATPFGFAVRNERFFVSEAVGGAAGASVLSSYSVNNNGLISLVQGSVAAGQSAACWVVLTNNGKYAYTTNTASANITKFGISNAGGISVSQAIATTTQAGPIDAALSKNSKYLYVLNGSAHSIQAFAVSNDGSLTAVQTTAGLPVGTNGLAAN